MCGSGHVCGSVRVCVYGHVCVYESVSECVCTYVRVLVVRVVRFDVAVVV